jgi:DNA modification methylase
MNQFFSGNSVEILPTIKRNADLFIADIPYNIGFNYDCDYNDNLPEHEYLNNMKQIGQVCFDNCVEGGSMFIIHYPRKAAQLLPLYEQCGWDLHQWITWCYNSNVGHSKSKFTTASRAILWFSKGKPKFNHKATVQPYKNPTDKRIKDLINKGHLGCAHYDWWNINLCKNVSKEYNGYANQIPAELLERIILHCTDEGDLVIDPCAGSGSTIMRAFELNRDGIGIDLNPSILKVVIE